MITSVGEERERKSESERVTFLLSFTSNYVVSVQRDFLFLLVHGMDCIILLWYSLGLPYDYFVIISNFEAVSRCKVKIDAAEAPHNKIIPTFVQCYTLARYENATHNI